MPQELPENAVFYEQPLNERVRTLMRLEFLFERISHALTGQSVWDSRAAMQALFEILDLTSGSNELKLELIKELERHSNTLNRLKNSRSVNKAALEAILENINQSSRSIHGLNSMDLENVRQNDFLVTVRQRSKIPGGTCLFDLPSLHHWLQQDYPTRSHHLGEWLAPFQPIKNGVQLILSLIRDSAIPTEETAVSGFFQKSLDTSTPNQMVRVALSENVKVFPEISAGRHRFSIRFMEQPDPRRRATQTQQDIRFQLICCAI